jgi:RHS repeat-associated protein
VTGQSGSVKARYDYLPFGEEIEGSIGSRNLVSGYNSDVIRQKFTSKERDTESGLDYFGMRYYGSAQGRFTSVDPLLETGDPEDPQSWNRYTYTFNNPLKYIDPTGGFAVPTAALTALANQQEEEKKRIKFEQVGQVRILGRDVAVYVATGQTKEYRDTVLKNAQSAAGVINANAKKLSAEDRRNIGNITAIAAPGQSVQPSERFYAEGIKGVDSSRLTNEGVDLGTGTFLTTQIVSAGADVFASQIGHDCKHVQDYKLSIGAYAPRWGTEWTEARSDLNERRALRYQLGLYRKLSGSSARSPDGYDKYIQERIKNPHRLPALKK